jgi:putative transposase
MDYHLSKSKESGEANRRNGHGKKKVKTKAGELSLRPPRDRAGTFQPVIVEKGSRLIKGGIDEIILALYAKGNSVDDIHRLLHQLYGIDYSSTAISTITDRVWPSILEWQNRPLRSCYLILYLDGIHFRVKEDGAFTDKCVYTLYSIDTEGQRDILGIYLSDQENASQWGIILEDLKRRGLEDVFIACVDGLPGFKQAIEQVYPKTIVQRCIVHKIRNSIRFVADKDRKKICADLRKVYSAVSKEQAAIALDVF